MPSRIRTAVSATLTAAVLGTSPSHLHAAGDPLPFTSEAIARGLQYTMPAHQTSGAFGWGMALADLNGNGHLDLVLLGRSNGLPGVFENDGTGHFINRSFETGILPVPQASGVIAFDFDGDGDLDLLFTQWPGSLLLYRNDGGFQFTEVGAEAGLEGFQYSHGANTGDFDGDGWLDLYICNYSPDAPLAINRLYRNRGDGTFEEVAHAQGVDSHFLGFQAVFAEIDGSGWPGLYLSNDHRNFIGFNQLWRNEQGTLVEITAESGAGVQLDSMGLAAGDLNGDGLTDFYVTNTRDAIGSTPGHHLLLSTGPGTYERADGLWGVSVFETGWGTHFWDYDNDGRLDLYVNHSEVPNMLFRNLGAPPMVEVAAALAVEGTTGPSYVSVFGDIDGSGALDLVQNNMGGNVRLYINHEGRTRNRFRLRIAGVHPNWHAVGAMATVRVHETKTTPSLEQWAQVRIGGNGYKGQSELVLHYGLDARTMVDEIEVRWPAGGPTRVLRNLAANEVWTAYHPDRLGDGNGDGVVDESDLALLLEWLYTPLVPGREMMDLDGDGAITRIDLALLYERAGWSRADLDRDGSVSGADLAILLSNWGSSDPIADLDGDGVVGGSDLGALLAAWG